jgi:hypothetical protein
MADNNRDKKKRIKLAEIKNYISQIILDEKHIVYSNEKTKSCHIPLIINDGSEFCIELPMSKISTVNVIGKDGSCGLYFRYNLQKETDLGELDKDAILEGNQNCENYLALENHVIKLINELPPQKKRLILINAGIEKPEKFLPPTSESISATDLFKSSIEEPKYTNWETDDVNLIGLTKSNKSKMLSVSIWTGRPKSQNLNKGGLPTILIDPALSPTDTAIFTRVKYFHQATIKDKATLKRVANWDEFNDLVIYNKATAQSQQKKIFDLHGNVALLAPSFYISKSQMKLVNKCSEMVVFEKTERKITNGKAKEQEDRQINDYLMYKSTQKTLCYNSPDDPNEGGEVPHPEDDQIEQNNSQEIQEKEHNNHANKEPEQNSLGDDSSDKDMSTNNKKRKRENDNDHEENPPKIVKKS